MTAAPMAFVVGVGRSGTTLLRSMLDAHPALAVSHESRFVAPMARHRGWYEAPGGFDRDRFLADLLGANPRVRTRADTWGLDRTALESALDAASPADLAGAVRAVCRAYAAARGKQRYGDKTPGYVRFLPDIAALLPEARFVHLVRDGRDVTLSMRDVEFGGANVPHTAWEWASQVRRCRRDGCRLGPERYLELRYEDLLDAPEESLRGVCAFLTLPYDDAMLRWHERGAQYDGLAGQRHHDRLALPATRGLRDWRTQLAPRDIAAFEAIASETLATLGYPLSGPVLPPSPPARLLAGARVAAGRARASWRGHRRRSDRRRTASSVP